MVNFRPRNPPPSKNSCVRNWLNLLLNPLLTCQAPALLNLKLNQPLRGSGLLVWERWDKKKFVRGLLKSGHDISVWNRTPEKCKQFVDIGVKQFMTISEFVWSCDFIFSYVSGPEASNSIFFWKNCILRVLGHESLDQKGLSKCQLSILLLPPNYHPKGAKYLEAPINGLKINAEDPPPILAAKDHGLFLQAV
ncbi:oxidoreductase GLYR1 [Trichonephila clavipes]|nr:oxidoreductase GLYR1 [Trichonephila clavipes]